MTLTMKIGCLLRLRPNRTRDYGTAYEIFVLEPYRCCRSHNPREVRKIVDVGAQVGFASLYFDFQYPHAQIHAFEPNPKNLEALMHNLHLNHLTERVTVHRAAAFSQAGHAYITDAGNESQLKHGSGPNRVAVATVDFFSAVRGEPIDILKMDIEGSEYALLSDSRFQTLDVRRLVLEWHNDPEHSDGKSWCKRRLEQCGYESYVVTERPQFGTGILWAYPLSGKIGR